MALVIDSSRICGDSLHRQTRLAVDIYQADDVARINQVRVADFGVVIPDFRPQPRITEKTSRNVPEGVALLNYMTLRMSIPQGAGIRKRGQAQHEGGEEPGKFSERHRYHLIIRLLAD